MTLIIHLTEHERIKLQTYHPPEPGGFQGLLIYLRDRIGLNVQDAGGTIEIPAAEWTYQERFARYRSDQYGDGGWEGFLRKLVVTAEIDGTRFFQWEQIRDKIYEGQPTQDELFK